MYMKIVFAAVLMSFLSTNASAYTECLITPTSVYTGGGLVWINYSNGGTGSMSLTNPNANQLFAMATAAIVAGKMLKVRYALDGVTCSYFGQTLEGAWLSSSQ